MDNKIKWGILGLGKIAHKFASDLKLSDDSVIQAVASRSKEKAEQFAQKYGAIKYYSSYEEMVQDPDIEVVYIATPHTFHFENTMMCLQNNKSVLCEKPMGIDRNQVETMIKEAQSRNLFLMEGMWTRFIPATEKLMEIIEDGEIGDLISVRADFGFKAEYNLQGRMYNKKLGGGSLLDLGIYPVYLSLLLLGMPNKIKAMARMTETEVDASCNILFDYPNSAKAMLESTIEADTPIEAYIYGSKGQITLHNRFHHSEMISVIKDGNVVEVHDVKYTGEGYYHEIQEVNACLKNNKTESDKLSSGTSLKLITLLDEIKNDIGLEY